MIVIIIIKTRSDDSHIVICRSRVRLCVLCQYCRDNYRRVKTLSWRLAGPPVHLQYRLSCGSFVIRSLWYACRVWWSVGLPLKSNIKALRRRRHVRLFRAYYVELLFPTNLKLIRERVVNESREILELLLLYAKYIIVNIVLQYLVKIVN